ncbi:hypothetical protein BCR32DRAFT_243947 [Anaeromyces robustus]|jgi:hypothetical protein|uniref:Transglutaminase-like domain-containing protein n=1 Tax=Anaeromyces robustus TaxID=1754192 RepID=A0A1Y1XAG4_9FUNG|nr:hypothetical protein BCR32DRAFT_243947 [Anaeromyces robustus]|eukprot:ORX82742.1 hypothetical protein BCR32DRAFT_243947 [Anaeromyces robustus]
MKNFIFVTLVVLIQLFLAVESRAVGKEVSVIYEVDVGLEKYKDDKKEEFEFEGEVDTPDENIFKRMALEDDEEFDAELDDDVVDEIPLEYGNEEDKLFKRGSISSSEYFRSQLSTFERKIYDSLNNISKPNKISKLTYTLSKLKSSKVKKANILKYSSRGIGALVRDHPEYWWIKQYKIKYGMSGSYIDYVTVQIKSAYSISNINSYNTKVKSKAKSIATAAKKKSGTYNRLLYIHDYLVKYVKYTSGGDYTYNVYGALVKNASACEGYAESFAYIARLISVPTICVTSKTHKWNYVYLSSKWYVVDVTYDDPKINKKNFDSGDSSNLSRKFFLIGKNTVVKSKNGKNLTYTTYSNRDLTSYLEFTDATGFKYPTLSTTAYKQ